MPVTKRSTVSWVRFAEKEDAVHATPNSSTDAENRLATEVVGERAGAKRSEGQPEQRCAQYRAKRWSLHAPFADERRRDEADRGGIESIRQDNDEAQGEDDPLKAGKRMLVQKRLNIDTRSWIHV